MNTVDHWTSALLACYGAGFLLACPVVGWVTDRLPSRRAVFTFAVFQLAVSTILFCLGKSVAIFVIARILQGVSSAITWTAALTLLADNIGQTGLGKAMGICSVGMNGALLLAPITGGLVLESSGFTLVFVITLVIIAMDLLLRFLVIERVSAEQYEKGPASFWTITYGSHGTPVISPLSSSENESFETPLLLLYDTSFMDNLSEESAKPTHKRLSPILFLLKSRRLCLLLWITLVQITMMTAFDAVLPLFTHEVFGWNSLGAGLIFIPVVLPALVAPWIGELSDKYGPRLFILAGFVTATPVFMILRTVAKDEIGHVVLLCTLLSILSLAMAFVMAPVMAEIRYVVESEERRLPGLFGDRGSYAQAYALYAFASAGGLLLGPVLGGFLAHAAGWGNMNMTLGFVAAITAVLVFFWLQ